MPFFTEPPATWSAWSPSFTEKLAHALEQIGEKGVNSAYEDPDLLAHDDQQKADKKKPTAILMGKPNSMMCTWGRSGHKPGGNLNGKQGNRDRRSYLDGDNENLAGERKHLPENVFADKQNPRRDYAERFRKAPYHVQMAVQHQKGQQADHPDKEGCGADLVCRIAGRQTGSW